MISGFRIWKQGLRTVCIDLFKVAGMKLVKRFSAEKAFEKDSHTVRNCRGVPLFSFGPAIWDISSSGKQVARTTSPLREDQEDDRGAGSVRHFDAICDTLGLAGASQACWAFCDSDGTSC